MCSLTTFRFLLRLSFLPPFLIRFSNSDKQPTVRDENELPDDPAKPDSFSLIP